MTKAPKGWRKVGYLIPEVIEPEENICVCVPIPKDWGHINAFMGQLSDLSKWLTWQKSGGTDATDAARRWFDIVNCVAEEINCIMTNDCGCSGDNVTNRRYSADGHLQVSHDGGATWENDDANDPRFNSAVFAPIPGGDGDEKKCIAANSMVAFLKDQQSASSAVLAAAGGVAGLLVAVAAAVAATGVGIVPAVILAIMGGILNIVASGGQTVFDDSFTTQVWDDLLCDIFCTIEDDGSFTDADWSSIVGKAATLGSYPADAWLSYMIKTAGPVGATNMARSGLIGTASCDSCDCGCGGETIGLSMVNSFGSTPVATGCNVKATSEPDGGFYSVTWTWDGTNPFKLTAEALVSGSTGTSQWQWYDGLGAGPFIAMGAPIGGTLSFLELSGIDGAFRVSWDVETP